MPTQLERELSMVPVALKKSKGKLGDASALADRGDPAKDDACDTAREKKILEKIVALKKRMVFWTRKLAESVDLKSDIYLLTHSIMILLGQRVSLMAYNYRVFPFFKF